jgi:hypothetical protein
VLADQDSFSTATLKVNLSAGFDLTFKLFAQYPVITANISLIHSIRVCGQEVLSVKTEHQAKLRIVLAQRNMTSDDKYYEITN